MCIFCVFVCVCGRERKREREREGANIIAGVYTCIRQYYIHIMYMCSPNSQSIDRSTQPHNITTILLYTATQQALTILLTILTAHTHAHTHAHTAMSLD